MLDKIRKRKPQLFGHVCMMTGSASQDTKGMVEGSRQPGRSHELMIYWNGADKKSMVQPLMRQVETFVAVRTDHRIKEDASGVHVWMTPFFEQLRSCSGIDKYSADRPTPPINYR